jgi:hypothetical protein
MSQLEDQLAEIGARYFSDRERGISFFNRQLLQLKISSLDQLTKENFTDFIEWCDYSGKLYLDEENLKSMLKDLKKISKF